MSDIATTSSSEFAVTTSDHGLGYNGPQRLGRRLWAPMWVMSIAAFTVAFIVGLVRSNAVSNGGSEASILSLLHVQSGIMFIGFAAVFAAVSFAIARILGEFRKGGGEIQELTGEPVVTLKMPATARVLILGMMMAMMAIFIASIVHFVWAGQVSSGAVSLTSGENAFVVLEAVRRLGVATYLVSITFGLATITRVLRFQSVRIRELAHLPN